MLNSPSATLRQAGLFAIVWAAILLEASRSENRELSFVDALETAVYLAIAGGISFFARGKIRRSIVIGAIYSCLPLLVEFVRRGFGGGNATEVVQLMVVRNLALALCVFGTSYLAQRLALFLSIFLAIAALATVHHWSGYFCAAGYGLAASCWLIALSWERTGGAEAAAVQRRLPRRMLAGTAACILLFGVVGARTSGENSLAALDGWFPSSGGRGAHDPHATGGVNDGDALAHGKDQADSFGPIEGELFLQSEMPTLYDVFEETIGPPIRKLKTERAVGLSQDVIAARKRSTSVSQSSGKEFSTIRRRVQEGRDARLKDLKTAALLYVVGRTPLHLRQETFDQFDGRVWSQSGISPPAPPLAMQFEGEKPWVLTVDQVGKISDVHLLKIINLKSNRIPTPSNAVALHIDRIDRLDFFGRTADGLIEMPDREAIPQLQVIHVRSQATSLEGLAPPHESPPTDEAYPGQTELRALAQDWTRNVAPGAERIRAVVQRLQQECRLDPAAQLADDTGNSALEFLKVRRAGPAYQFASATAVLLRELGYQTRLVTGLYASPAAYDAAGGQTIVRGEDAHTWLEVSVDGRVWLSVEPTPGFELLAAPRSFAQQALDAARHGAGWARDHLGQLLAAATVLIAAWRYRRHAALRVKTPIWQLLVWLYPTRAAHLTLGLLASRCSAAGHHAPPGAARLRWLSDKLRLESREAAQAWEEFAAFAAKSLYGRSGPEPPTAAIQFLLWRSEARAAARVQ